MAYGPTSEASSYGRVFQQFDASGDSRGTRYVYNARGYVSQLRESRGGTLGEVYWTVQAMDARGNVTQALMGNGSTISATHDAATGALRRLIDLTDQDLPQDLELVWDAMGNLTRRHDRAGLRNQEERFWYDSRNRLTRTDSRVNGGTCVNNRQVQTYIVACSGPTPGRRPSSSLAGHFRPSMPAEIPHLRWMPPLRAWTSNL